MKQVVKTKIVRILDESRRCFRKMYITCGWLEDSGKIIDDSYFETQSPYLNDLSDMEETVLAALRTGAA